jgi:PIN domain
MSDLVPYYAVLDSNVWVTERLLQSSIGHAFLYAVSGAKSAILLPEVVELELARVLPDMAERAVAVIKRELSILRQLSGHQNLMLYGPSSAAIEDGINERWKQLGGLLVRLPFTHDQARSALDRVIRKTAPSGENNEQFRDCCIWDAAVSMSADRIVHVISADAAFYEGRNRTAGLAGVLRAELAAKKVNIRLHSSLKDFLASMGASAAAIDEPSIAEAITKALLDQARAIAANDDSGHRAPRFELGTVYRPEIRGYATPTPSMVAISFEARFDLEPVGTEDEDKKPGELPAATMVLKGVSSYDPIAKCLSDLEIREWSKSLKTPWGSGWGSTSPDNSMIERQYGPGRIRIIS